MNNNTVTLDLIDFTRPAKYIENKYSNTYKKAYNYKTLANDKNSLGSHKISTKIQKKIFTVMLLISIIVVIATLYLFAAQTKAQSNDSVVYYKYFHIYEVKYGDTLWDIAKRYNYDGDVKGYIKEVRKINHIYDDNIITGQHITIPYYLTYIK